MTLTRSYCPLCRADTLHGRFNACLHCKTVEAVTHPAAYRTEQEMLQRKSNRKRTPA